MDRLQLAVETYLETVYGDDPPARAVELLPALGQTPAEYLGGERIERSPVDAQVEQARSFALRLGNRQYPNMKLRISRPPHDPVYLFHVDCHDEILQAPPGSADHEPLEELKRYNASLARKVHEAWHRHGLPTQETYLRWKIGAARDQKGGR